MEKQTKKTPVLLSVIGGLALTAAALYAAPMILERLSDFFGDPSAPQKADDDWGPVIVRRETPKRSEEGE